MKSYVYNGIKFIGTDYKFTMKKRILIQLQLSNYDTQGRFILEADSGYQMMFGRIREFLRLLPGVSIDVIGPNRKNLLTQPEGINPDIFASGKVNWIEIDIIPNALATRYDFNFEQIADRLNLSQHKIDNNIAKYDVVYINDPMLLRNYKALFLLKAGYKPKFVVHSHFIDNPECPKFPTEASLWLGQCEAAIQADYNFWQCESAMNVFFDSMGKTYNSEVVEAVRAKSMPYDDGYSADETQTINYKNIRFDLDRFNELHSKAIIFVPNRIGGKGRSSDYTNCGKFMFELLPKLRQVRDDFVVITGNPSQKFSNEELNAMCKDYGHINLVDGTLNRDEYKFVLENTDIVLALYDQDTYGGTASREAIELGAWPLWLDCNEYKSISQEANYAFKIKPDFSDFVEVASDLIDYIFNFTRNRKILHRNLRNVVYDKCSYEMTTPKALKAIGLL